MLQKYARIRAFTGSNYDSALEAAHLYRYAEIGQHFENGGLLSRRDVHRWFDRGLLPVNPATQLIDVHSDVAPHQSYADLAGMPLRVEIPSGAKAGLALHREEHRSSL